MITQALRLLTLTSEGQASVAVTPQPVDSLSDLLTLGRALQAQKRHAEALPFFQRATLADPNSFDAWFNLGVTLNELHRYSDALPVYERAMTLDPNSAVAGPIKATRSLSSTAPKRR